MDNPTELKQILDSASYDNLPILKSKINEINSIQQVHMNARILSSDVVIVSMGDDIVSKYRYSIRNTKET